MSLHRDLTHASVSMEDSIRSWRNDSLKGKRTRIFREETYGPLRLFTSPNNIAAVLLESTVKYEFIEKEVGKKIRRNSRFIAVDGNDISLPFDFVLKEIVEDHQAEYAAIIFRL